MEKILHLLLTHPEKGGIFAIGTRLFGFYATCGEFPLKKAEAMTVSRFKKLFFFILLLLGAVMLLAPLAPASEPREKGGIKVLSAELHGPVTPAQADLLEDVLQAARTGDMDLVLLRLDTPGGLVSSMRVMIKEILNSPVPVAIWVGPSGAHAASAGVFLVAASDVAGMAPQTTIGAASPVDMQGKDVDETMARKVKNDLMGLLRGVATARNRNLDWYERSVEEAVSATAQEAVMENVVEFVAVDTMDFLEQAGRRGIIAKPGSGRADLRFAVADVQLTEFEPSVRYKFLSWLLHPQIAYILLLGGIAGLFFELTTPGAILPGVLGGFCLLMGLYALSVLPTNATGVLLLLFSFVLFLLELKITSFGLLTLAGMISLFVGSMLLIKPGQGFSRLPMPMVLVTMGGIAAIGGVCVFYIGRSMRQPPASGREALIGETAKIRSWDGTRGKVFLQGAIWDAVSDQRLFLEKDAAVRISGVQGLTLRVQSETQATNHHGSDPDKVV